MQYRTTKPLAEKSEYLQGTQVQFKILLEPNTEIIKNSITLSGYNLILDTNSPVAANTDIRYDSKIGMHSLLQEVVSQVNGLTVETLSYYPRYMRMVRDATMTDNDMFMASKVAELCCPSDEQTSYMVKGIGRPGAHPDLVATEPLPFWVKPHISLNRSNRNIKATDVQQLDVIISLGQIQECLWGLDVDNNITYKLSDLQLNYQTTQLNPVDAKSPLVFQTLSVAKQTIKSANANIQFLLKSVARGVSMSFIKSSHEMNYQFNNTETEMLPNIADVQVSFADNNSAVLAHKLDNLEEIVENYKQSFARVNERTSVTPYNINMGKSFGVGLDWGGYLDLSGQKFSVDIQSDADNINTYSIFAYFHGMIQV